MTTVPFFTNNLKNLNLFISLNACTCDTMVCESPQISGRGLVFNVSCQLFKKMIALCCADLVLKPEDCPLSFGASSYFEIRKTIHDSASNKSHSKLTSFSRSPSLDISTGMNGSNGFSDAEMLTGKLKLHGELIKALQTFASQSTADGLFESSGAMSREVVLEQALVEQNQILDVMQELISTLEAENKQSREKLNKQSRVISGLEVKLRQDEKALAELRSRPHSMPLPGNDSEISELKRQLNAKDHTIASLQSKRGRESESMLLAKVASAKAKLEIERVHNIELEETLTQAKVSTTRLNRDLDSKNAEILKKESEITHLTHEMESMRKFEQQQQDLIVKQRGTLSSKDAQVRSLTRALSKEKKVADQLRRIQLGTSGLSPSPKANDSTSADSLHSLPSLFEQLAGRMTFSVELMRITPESELGFSFAKVGTGKNQSLIVKNVKDGSLAGGLLKVGDELLEVNGLQCRSYQQLRAISILEKGDGILKLVVARSSDSPVTASRIFHSTPSRFGPAPESTQMSSIWATALHSSNPTFQNFSIENSTVDEPQASDARYVTVPEALSQSATPNSSLDHGTDRSDRGEINLEDKPRPGTPVSISSVNETESLVTVSSREEMSIKKLQYEVADLQDQLDESERLRLEFESTLETTQKELNKTKSSSEMLLSENKELRHLLDTRDNEVSDIEKYISELQSSLVVLQSQVVNDQQKIASLENQNKIMSAELVETRASSKEDIQAKENLRDVVRTLKSELEENQKETLKLREKFQEQNLERAHLASAAKHMEKELKTLKEAIQTEKRESEAALLASKQECHTLQSRLEEMVEVSDKTKAISQDQFDHINNQLKSAKAMLAEAELKNSQTFVELSYHKQAADQANKQLERLEADHQKNLGDLRHYKQELERKTLEMQSMTVGLKGVQSKLEGKQLITTRLQGEVGTLRRTNAKLKNEAIHFKEILKEAELNLMTSKSLEEHLGESLRASAEEKNDLFAQLEKSYEESTELTLEVEKLNAELCKLKEQYVADSKSTVDELVKSSKLVEARLQGELESGQKKVELLSRQVLELKKELKSSQEKADTLAEELKKEKSERLYLMAAKKDLSKELCDGHEKNLLLHSEVDSKQQELEDASSALEELKEKKKIEKENSALHLSKINDLESELKLVKLEKEKAIGIISSLEFIQKQQEEKLEHENKMVKDKERNIKQKNSEIDDLNVKLEKSATDNTELTKSVASMKQQLKESQRAHKEAVKVIQDELSLRHTQLSTAREDLKLQRSKEEILNSKIEYLAGSLEKMTKEKCSLEDSTEVSVKCIEDLQSHDKQLTIQCDNLKNQLSSATESNNLLSSEASSLRHQLRQNEKELDQIQAQLHAAEINLEVCHRTISENEKVLLFREQKLEEAETQYKAACDQIKELKAQVSASSLENCNKDEEISNLKTTLELHQNDSIVLQSSLVTLQSEFDESKRQMKDLEMESKLLQSSLEEAGTIIIENENTIKNLKEGISDQNQQKERLAESHLIEVKCMKEKEEELGIQIQKLKYENEELEKRRKELESAQEELKGSVSKLGNEKDIEIVKLQDEVRSATQKISEVEDQCGVLRVKEQALNEAVKDLKTVVSDLEEQLKQERCTSQSLRDEVQVHEETLQDIQRLNEKVSLLSISAKEKSNQVVKLEDSLNNCEIKVKDLQAENEALLEKVSELAALKQIVADQDAVIADSTRKLKQKDTDYEHVLKERDQFLSTVRELEIKHHQKVPSPQPAKINASTGNEDIAKLRQLLAEREDEVVRTRQFTEELLINVMMNAPSLLEK